MFDGNIEEQARILCKQFMKREILDHLPEQPKDDNAEDSEAEMVDEEHDLADEQPAAAATVIENGTTSVANGVAEKAPFENGGVQKEVPALEIIKANSSAAAAAAQKATEKVSTEKVAEK